MLAVRQPVALGFHLNQHSQREHNWFVWFPPVKPCSTAQGGGYAPVHGHALYGQEGRSAGSIPVETPLPTTSCFQVDGLLRSGEILVMLAVASVTTLFVGMASVTDEWPLSQASRKVKALTNHLVQWISSRTTTTETW